MSPNAATKTLFEAAETDDLAAASAAIDAGADINAKDEFQRTPLHFAAWYGHTDLVRLLIENGADPTFKNEFQLTPLHLAVAHGHTEIVNMLQAADKAAPGQPTGDRMPPH